MDFAVKNFNSLGNTNPRQTATVLCFDVKLESVPFEEAVLQTTKLHLMCSCRQE